MSSTVRQNEPIRFFLSFPFLVSSYRPMLPQNLLGGWSRPVVSADYISSRLRRNAFLFAMAVSLLVPLAIWGIQYSFTKNGLWYAIAAAAVLIAIFCISELKTPSRSVGDLLFPSQHVLLAYNYEGGEKKLVTLNENQLTLEFERFSLAIPIAFIPRYPFGETGENFFVRWNQRVGGDSQQISLSGAIWLELPEAPEISSLMRLLEYSKESLAQVIAEVSLAILRNSLNQGRAPVTTDLGKPVTAALQRWLRLPTEFKLDVKINHLELNPPLPFFS